MEHMIRTVTRRKKKIGKARLIDIEHAENDFQQLKV
jgi:hypothetical protein